MKSLAISTSSIHGGFKFYFKNALFGVREEFSTVGAMVGSMLLYPFFAWLLSCMWRKFSGTAGIFQTQDLILYVGLTEIIQMTLLNANAWNSAASDFSLSLARPRSWILMSGSNIWGRSLGRKLVLLATFLAIMPFLSGQPLHTSVSAARFLFLLPWIVLVDTLVSLLLASARVMWERSAYFRLPISKFFMIFGGVFAPLCDLASPGREIFLASPFSDTIFQTCFFAVTGKFYGMSASMWVFRMSMFCSILAVANVALLKRARKAHQAYGG